MVKLQWIGPFGSALLKIVLIEQYRPFSLGSDDLSRHFQVAKT